jgi:hypothetical protein
MKYKHLFMKAIGFIIILTCFQYTINGQTGTDLKSPDKTGFHDYWYQGKAEITSYTLEQARYGEIHQGEAVLIFVTEDFSRRKQVKLDDPARAGDDAVSVLKLNFTKKFNTGIYPYSMMLSIFTPVHHEKYTYTLKATASSQEWCGHTFTQLNLRDNKYFMTLYSYFESEGDQSRNIPRAILEDELWTRIRIDPTNLPVGNVKLIPGLLAQRLRHTVIQPQNARVSLESEVSGVTPKEMNKGEEQMKYTIQYNDDDRILVIYFQKEFPYQILKWEETYMDGFGQDAKKLTTKAERHRSIMIDYWNKNKPTDTHLRESLGLMNYDF